jgi:hypothetical protein
VEVTSGDKHSSLFRQEINYGLKCFIVGASSPNPLKIWSKFTHSFF